MASIPARTGSVARNTTETKIAITVNLDGTGAYDVSTGIGFLDHMVEQFSRHSLIDVTMKVEGDLHVDQHHTTEDSAIALGQAIAQALGDKAGIGRYGAAYSPMDETLSRVALDISGRPYLVWKAKFTQERLGEWDTELIEHWFHSVSQAAGITLHMELLYGTNNHHICESLYKGFARAMRQAVERDPRKGGAIPSTKGSSVGEIDLAESPEEARTAVEWLRAHLAQMGAVAGEGLAGVAGSVDAAMQSYTLPSGATLEVWSGNYTALSLRGDAGLIAALAADYREASARG